jgi:hypothetical protein
MDESVRKGGRVDGWISRLEIAPTFLDGLRCGMDESVRRGEGSPFLLHEIARWARCGVRVWRGNRRATI